MRKYGRVHKSRYYAGYKSYGRYGADAHRSSTGFNKLVPPVYAVCLLLAAVLQPTVVQWISVGGISLNLFLIFTVCSGLNRGKVSGAVCGCLFGLVFDLLTGRMIGISGICYMYAGFVTGIIKESILKSDGCVSAAVFTACAGFVCGIVYFFAYGFAYGSPGFFRGIIRTVIPAAVYSGIGAFILARPIRFCFGLINGRRMF